MPQRPRNSADLAAHVTALKKRLEYLEYQLGEGAAEWGPKTVVFRKQEVEALRWAIPELERMRTFMRVVDERTAERFDEVGKLVDERYPKKKTDTPA